MVPRSGKDYERSLLGVTSIRVNPELWKEVRKYCIDHEIGVSELIEQLLKERIKTQEK